MEYSRGDRGRSRTQGTVTSDTKAGAGAREAVLHVHGITKVYRLGEVEVHALRGSTSTCTTASSSCCSAPRAAASPRCSTSSAGSTCRPAARCAIRDHDLTAADERELTRFRREHVGFVFQFYNLIPSLTARENVALVTEIAAQPHGPAREALALVGLGDRLRPLPGAALRRRAAARRDRARDRQAARRAAVRRADRRARLPTGKLVLEVLERVNRELGTHRVITHNAAIAGMADRVIRMQQRPRSSTSMRNATPARAPAELSW